MTNASKPVALPLLIAIHDTSSGPVTGKFNKIKLRNELEAWGCLTRDQQEKDKIIAGQLWDRQFLQSSIRKHQHQRSLKLQDIQSEISAYVRLGRGEIPNVEQFDTASGQLIRPQQNQRQTQGPEFKIT